MKSWSIAKRTTFGFAAVTLIIVLLGAFVFWRLLAVRNDTTAVVTDWLPGLSSISEVEGLARANYIQTLRHVLEDDSQRKTQLAAEIEANVARINELTNRYALTMTLPEDREMFNAIVQARPAYVAAFKKVMEASDQGKSKEALDLVDQQLEGAYEKFRGTITTLVEFNRDQAERAGKEVLELAASMKHGLVVGLCLSVVAAVGIAAGMIRSVTVVLNRVASSLEDGSNQVAAAAGQVAAAGQSLAEGASEQAASLEETSASLEEMASMTKRNAEGAQHAKTVAAETRSAAETGVNDMREMNRAMDAIKFSSDNIAKIIKTIEDIAFQTNILALNAAVEAARAGEAGMGFAVVADEVRNLAQRSAQAAKETAGKIEDSIEKSQSGVELSARVSQSFEQIAEKARQVDEFVKEIASASGEQSQGIEQVNMAVVQMDKVTQSNAANAEESASAAEEMSAQAEALREAVGELLVLAGNKRQKGLQPAATPPRDSKWNHSTLAHLKQSPTQMKRSGHQNLPVTIGSVPAQRSSGAHKRSAIPLEDDFENM